MTSLRRRVVLLWLLVVVVAALLATGAALDIVAIMHTPLVHSP